MSAFGKKILSAFVEINEKAETTIKEAVVKPFYIDTHPQQAEANNKFIEHFNKVFKEANLPRPDYYEFSKMTEAMQSISNEQARYSAAFAGLQVQGLDKQKLLSSVQQYLQLLTDDESAFTNTINDARSEKVNSKKDEIEAAKNEIQHLSQQILNLQKQIAEWTEEVTENELKIKNSQYSYTHALESCKQRLSEDIEKINQYIF